MISEIADSFGSQCVVISIDYKVEKDGRTQVYSNSGKIPTGLNPLDLGIEG